MPSNRAALHALITWHKPPSPLRNGPARSPPSHAAHWCRTGHGFPNFGNSLGMLLHSWAFEQGKPSARREQPTIFFIFQQHSPNSTFIRLLSSSVALDSSHRSYFVLPALYVAGSTVGNRHEASRGVSIPIFFFLSDFCGGCLGYVILMYPLLGFVWACHNFLAYCFVICLAGSADRTGVLIGTGSSYSTGSGKCSNEKQA